MPYAVFVNIKSEASKNGPNIFNVNVKNYVSNLYI